MALSSKEFSALIKKIGTNAATQREQIQTAIISIAVYAQRDRNIDPAIRLMATIGTGVYRAGISKWLSLNAPIHFVHDEPKLASSRQKENEVVAGYSIEQFEADISIMPKWHEIDAENNIAPNVWDTAVQLRKVDDYLMNAIKRFAKHDASVAEALDMVHNQFRSGIGKVVEFVEV